MSAQDTIQNTKTLCESLGIGWHAADDALLLADDLAQSIAQQLQSDIDKNGTASLVVSGGSTPKPLFEALRTRAIEWSKVAVTLADERWVPVSDKDSNEALVRKTLLVDNAAAASFVPLYLDGMAADDAVAKVTAGVAQMQQPFSVTILGMGGDGHTASLFPDADASHLRAAMSLASEESVAILKPPSVGQVRISLTRAALLRSRQRIVHITGITKLQVLYDALLESGDPAEGLATGEYTEGNKPIVGLLTTQPQTATVFWSP